MDRPHDKLIKEVFGNMVHARRLLEAVLPPNLVDYLDLDTLEQAPGSVVDKENREVHADLLFRLKTREHGSALCYLLLEHRSRITKWLVLDLLGYAVRVLEEAAKKSPSKLPLVIPVALVHDPKSAQRTTSIQEITQGTEEFVHHLQGRGLHFRIFLEDLARFDDEALLTRPIHDAIKMTFLALRHSRSPPDMLTAWVRFADLVKNLIQTQDGATLFWQLTNYTMSVAQYFELDQMIEVLRHEVSQEAGEIAMSMADKLRDEGRVQGRAEGRVNALRELLEARFGSLPQSVVERIESASIDDLRRWNRQLLDAETLDQVFQS